MARLLDLGSPCRRGRFQPCWSLNASRNELKVLRRPRGTMFWLPPVPEIVLRGEEVHVNTAERMHSSATRLGGSKRPPYQNTSIRVAGPVRGAPAGRTTRQEPDPRDLPEPHRLP